MPSCPLQAQVQGGPARRLPPTASARSSAVSNQAAASCCTLCAQLLLLLLLLHCCVGLRAGGPASPVCEQHRPRPWWCCGRPTSAPPPAQQVHRVTGSACHVRNWLLEPGRPSSAAPQAPHDCPSRHPTSRPHMQPSSLAALKLATHTCLLVPSPPLQLAVARKPKHHEVCRRQARQNGGQPRHRFGHHAHSSS